MWLACCWAAHRSPLRPQRNRLGAEGGKPGLRALRLGGEVLDAVGLMMRPVLTGLRRAAR